MKSSKKTARIAGLLYLLAGIPGAFGIMYVSRTLIVPGNAPATADNILTSEMLFRFGLVSELVSAIALLFLALVLYRLFKGVDKAQASLMVALVVISVPISFLNVVNGVAALALLHGADFLAAIDKPQLDALGMLFLGLRRAGFVVNGFFWGLWLLPFGLLVIKSGFIPRIFGVLLIASCSAYVIGSLAWLLAPEISGLVNQIALVPEGLGEASIVAWLLIKGVRAHPPSAQPA